MLGDEPLCDVRAHAVAEENDWKIRVRAPLVDDHLLEILNDALEAALECEETKSFGRRRGLAMTAMIVAINDEAGPDERFGDMRVASDMLGHAVGDVNDTTRRSASFGGPTNTVKDDLVTRAERKDLGLHDSTLTRLRHRMVSAPRRAFSAARSGRSRTGFRASPWRPFERGHRSTGRA